MTTPRTLLYFTSGTGNSYRLAQWFADTAVGKGMAADIRPIEKADPESEISDGENLTLGLFYPTHGFTAPWHMIRFVLRLPRSNARAVICAARAGMKFGPLFTPGVAGSGPFLIALILALKGYRILGMAGFDMPSNWTALHPGYSEKNAVAIIDRTRPKLARFADDTLEGRKRLVTANTISEAILGLALSWISVLYLLLGRFFLAKLWFASNRCTGCGTCAEICPVGAIRIKGRGAAARPFWKYNCESCMRCMNFCPERAIESAHSWAVVLYLIATIPVGMLFWNRVADAIPTLSMVRSGLGETAMQWGFMYLTVFVMYYPLFWLNRLPVINKLFTFTTLTHIYRRYREPGTRLKNLLGKKKNTDPQR